MKKFWRWRRKQRSPWEIQFAEIQKDPHWQAVLDAVNNDVTQHIAALTPQNIAEHSSESRLRVHQLRQLHEVQRRFAYTSVQGLPAPQRPRIEREQGAPLFVVGSLFLDECRQYLLQGQPEWMHAVTGLAVDNLYTLDHVVHLATQQQSRGGVTADPASVFDALIHLSEYGHALHAVFHSHRMNGIPQPSSIDRGLQRRLGRGGYHTIQCIFSEDGYLYWFSGEQPFELMIFGKGIRQVDEHTYQFSNAGQIA